MPNATTVHEPAVGTAGRHGNAGYAERRTSGVGSCDTRSRLYLLPLTARPGDNLLFCQQTLPGRAVGAIRPCEAPGTM